MACRSRRKRVEGRYCAPYVVGSEGSPTPRPSDCNRLGNVHSGPAGTGVRGTRAFSQEWYVCPCVCPKARLKDQKLDRNAAARIVCRDHFFARQIYCQLCAPFLGCQEFVPGSSICQLHILPLNTSLQLSTPGRRLSILAVAVHSADS